MLYPYVARPMTIIPAPKANIHTGVGELEGVTTPFDQTQQIAAKGPMAFAVSLEPWAKELVQAVKTWRNENKCSVYTFISSEIKVNEERDRDIPRYRIALLSHAFPPYASPQVYPLPPASYVHLPKIHVGVPWEYDIEG